MNALFRDENNNLVVNVTFNIGYDSEVVPRGVFNVVKANPALYCTKGNNFNGNVALINRGTCSIPTKIQNAIEQGASGIIIVSYESLSITPYFGSASPIWFGGTPKEYILSNWRE